MIRSVLRLGAATLLSLGLSLSLAPGARAQTGALAQTGDEAAIRAIEAGQEAAWNAHDITAYVRPLSPDVDFVTATGHWWKSREEVAGRLGTAFGALFAESRLHFDSVETKRLSADTATAHILWSLDGAKTPDGGEAGPLRGVSTQTLRKTAAGWTIVALQDTLALRAPPAAGTTGAPPAALPAPAAASATQATDAAPAKPGKPRRCLLGSRGGQCLIYK